jgi:hypothetical protein
MYQRALDITEISLFANVESVVCSHKAISLLWRSLDEWTTILQKWTS